MAVSPQATEEDLTSSGKRSCEPSSISQGDGLIIRFTFLNPTRQQTGTYGLHRLSNSYIILILLLLDVEFLIPLLVTEYEADADRR
ncbi:hypothetical protein CISIN_1g042180mg [Citrus sinensis]|uniref:Uncharacterized protein n=1 Tax=Citrus sinensis TaxID=2711 RepID=A0A067HD31_CITSI|nr:hypothetical protein CISIN_1g042180mg [Citrus sinensis]